MVEKDLICNAKDAGHISNLILIYKFQWPRCWPYLNYCTYKSIHLSSTSLFSVVFVGWYPDSLLKCLYNINDQFFIDFQLYLPYRVVFNGIIVKWCIAFYCEVMPSSFPKTIISKFWRNISWSSLIRSFSINNYYVSGSITHLIIRRYF